jgi:ADP-ribose pyrophosphatase YjhB (NUDIX family)
MKKFRIITLGIIKNNDKILLECGYDKVRDLHFYRPLGGGVEFMERSEEALMREFMEELKEKINVKKCVGFVENIFHFEGDPGHELVILHEAEFDNKDLYESEKIIGFEDDSQREIIAEWISLEDIKAGKFTVFPDRFLEFI